MNTSNPFQIPTCFQRPNPQLRRRNRFKTIVISSVALVAALLVAVLIEGCMSEHARTSATAQTMAPEPAATLHDKVAVTATEPVVAMHTNPVVPPAISSTISAPSAASPAESIYIVKSGDTLSRIAKIHHLTIKEIKAINALGTDEIVIGMKLKLPAA